MDNSVVLLVHDCSIDLCGDLVDGLAVRVLRDGLEHDLINNIYWYKYYGYSMWISEMY